MANNLFTIECRHQERQHRHQQGRLSSQCEIQVLYDRDADAEQGRFDLTMINEIKADIGVGGRALLSDQVSENQAVPRLAEIQVRVGWEAESPRHREAAIGSMAYNEGFNTNMRSANRSDFINPMKSEYTKEKSMTMLQTLCKAIMLRRTKESTFEGQPILVLPPRTTEVVNPVFDDDEEKFYRALENRTQLTFNKYLRVRIVWIRDCTRHSLILSDTLGRYRGIQLLCDSGLTSEITPGLLPPTSDQRLRCSCRRRRLSG